MRLLLISYFCDGAHEKPYMGQVELPELIVITCWYLWWQRREFVKGEEVQTPERTTPAIMALALNYMCATGKVRTKAKINRWPLVLIGHLVLNVDAFFSVGTNSGACGAIIRDHKGRFITASNARLNMPHFLKY